MAASVSDGSSPYWRQVDLILPNGKKVVLTVDLPTYTKVCNKDTETVKELIKNYNEMRHSQYEEEPGCCEQTPLPTQIQVLGEVGPILNEGQDGEIKPTCARHEWTALEVRKLLCLIKDNIDKLNAARSKTPIWRQIGEAMNISAEKCQDKYKYLRKAYRNHVQKNNKTGNAPSKFEYSDEMADIMGDDPSVIPAYTASSDEPQDDDTTINEESTCTTSEETTTADTPVPKKSRKRSMDVMIEYLQERDDSLKKIMKDMHDESMEAMNRLIDKF